MFYHEQLSNSYNFMINASQSGFLPFVVACSNFFNGTGLEIGLFIESELQFCMCLCTNVQKSTKRGKPFSDLSPCMGGDCPTWPAFHRAPWMAKKEGCGHCWKSVLSSIGIIPFLHMVTSVNSVTRNGFNIIYSLRKNITKKSNC